MPVTEDVEVSYELHRYIIGQKGSGIRKMMEEYEVSAGGWVGMGVAALWSQSSLC